MSTIATRTTAADARLRIAYIATAFPWRSETAVIKEMHELSRMGFDIRVFSLKRVAPGDIVDPKAGPFRDRTWYPGPLALLRGLGRSALLLPFRGAYRDLLRLTLRRSGRYLWKNLYILILATELAAIARREGVRYLHANFASFQAFAALAVSRLAGIPFGFTVHAHDIFLHDFMIPEKVAAASLVLSISRYNVDYMQRHFGVSAERIEVIRCGVDLTEFAPGTATAASGGGAPLLLSVGRLDPMKGYDTILDALGTLVTDLDFRLLIVGAGDERVALERRIRDRGLAGRAEIRTGVPHDELIGLYRRCRVYLQACRRKADGEQDGIPATLMEAMAVGKPVVATRLSGIPELVEDGVEGILVPPEQPIALAEAVRALLADPGRADDMGRAARSRVEREFDIAANGAAVGRRIAALLSDEQRKAAIS